MAKSIKSKLTKADKNCPKLGHFTTNHKEPTCVRARLAFTFIGTRDYCQRVPEHKKMRKNDKLPFTLSPKR